MVVSNPLDELKKLAELHRSGVITTEEFDAKKAELLSLIGVSGQQVRSATPAVASLAVNSVVTQSQSPAERVAALDQQIQQGDILLKQLSHSLRQLRGRYIRLLVQQWYGNVLLFCRSQQSLSGTRFLLATLSAIISAALLMLTVEAVLFVVGVGGFVATLGGLLAAGTLLLNLWAVPGVVFVEQLVKNTSVRLASTKIQRTQVMSSVESSQARLALLRSERAQLEKTVTSRRYQLANINWRAMRGHEFEGFLGDVFKQLGYKVELTGKSGDQGADLILAKGNRRIVVQAKGYVESVSNGAVQEAHTAKDFYECQESIVITNSVFTTSARELASRVGCKLIDGEMIPDLIDGKVM